MRQVAKNANQAKSHDKDKDKAKDAVSVNDVVNVKDGGGSTKRRLSNDIKPKFPGGPCYQLLQKTDWGRSFLMLQAESTQARFDVQFWCLRRT